MLDECNFFLFSFSPSSPLPSPLRAREQEALHHPDRRRKRREGERKRDCDGGIKGYPSLSVTSFIVPCSVLPAHPSSAVTHTFLHTNTHMGIKAGHTHFDSPLSALFHTFTAMTQKRTHTLRSVSQTHTAARKPHTHTFTLGSPPCFTHSAMTDTHTRKSLRTRASAHVYELPAKHFFRKVEALRPTSCILQTTAETSSSGPPLMVLLWFSQDPRKTRRRSTRPGHFLYSAVFFRGPGVGPQGKLVKWF